MLKIFLAGLLLTIFCTLYAPVSAPGAEKFEGKQSTGKYIQSSSIEDTDQRMVSLRPGDVFRGRAELAKTAHNPAELTLHIKKATSKDATDSEFEIEAVAVMKISNTYVVYGLHGIYVPDWGQLELYEVRETASGTTESGGRVINSQFFEPVGLAGRVTEDNQEIHCHIAYNGNASLVRLKDGPAHFNFLYVRQPFTPFQKLLWSELNTDRPGQAGY